MITSPMTIGLLGTAYYAFLGTVFLLMPKLWRPEVPFGVTVPTGGSEAVRTKALRYWNSCVIVLMATMIVCVLLVASMKPNPTLVKLLVLPFFGGCAICYLYCRRMLLPFSRSSKKAGAFLSPKNYRDYMSFWWEIVPLCLVAIGVAATILNFLATSRADLPDEKRYTILVQCLIPGPFLYLAFLMISVLIAHSKRSLGGGDPEICLAASEAFRKVWIRYFYAMRVVLATSFALLASVISLGISGIVKLDHSWGVAMAAWIGGSVVVLVFIGFIIAWRYGQGGWRWAVRKGLVPKEQAPALINGDGMQDAHWKLGMFYFNPSDPSVLVEKRFGVGWTVNLGSMWGLGVLIVVLATQLLPYLLRLASK